MKYLKLLTATLLIFLFACKKEDVGPNYIRLNNPDEIILAISPANNAIDIGIDTSLLIEFSMGTYQNYTREKGSTTQMIKIDSVRLFTDDQRIEISASFSGWDKYAITPKVQLERGAIYTLLIKTHFMIWDGEQWVDNSPDGEIEYYDHSFSFQTKLPSIIASYYPVEGNNSVSIYTSPYISYHYPSDTIIQFENSIQKFRLNTSSLKLSYEGVYVSGEIHTAGNRVWYQANELPSESITATMEMEVNWQKFKEGTWTNCMRLDNTKFSESLTINFKFNSYNESSVDETQIKYSYPVQRQFNFLKEEYKEGYVIFDAPMGNFFNPGSGGNTNNCKAIFTENKTINRITADITYDESLLMATYEMPEILKNETIYNLNIVRITESDTSSIYSFYFRTSMFDTWEAKFSAYNIPKSFVCGTWPYYFGQELNSGVGVSSATTEGLDDIESDAGQYNVGIGLVRMDLVFEDNEHFDSFVNPNIYEPWTVDGFTPVLSRPEDPFGIPPVHSGLIRCGTAKLLTDGDITLNTSDRISPEVFSMQAFTRHFIYYDVIDVQEQIEQHFSFEEIAANPQLETINNYPPRKYYDAGDYKIRIFYKIPGLDIITTDCGEFTMDYRIAK